MDNGTIALCLVVGWMVVSWLRTPKRYQGRHTYERSQVDKPDLRVIKGDKP